MLPSPTTVERIGRLVAVLRRVPERRFDMDYVISNYDNKRWRHGLAEAARGHDNLECWSAACAMGYMPAAFPELCQWSPDYVEVILINPIRNVTCFEMAADVLQIPLADARWLFDSYTNYPIHPITKEMVIKRLENYAAGFRD